MANLLLSYAEAAEQVNRLIVSRAENESQSAAAESIPLGAALGRVLAEGLRADRDQPPFPRSTRDGFACRAAEANTHQLLFLAGRVRAGESASAPLGSGEVWEIMTGAPVPPGADAVFMVEHAELESNFVRLAPPRSIEAGENIVPQGAEARADDLLLPIGVRLGPAQIALAAQCGSTHLQVAPRPRVAILSTGDELVAVDQVPGPSQIRNSNAPMLAALVLAAGGEPIILPTASDDNDTLDRALGQILDQSLNPIHDPSLNPTIARALTPDLLLMTGGVSAGRFDLVEDALARAGAQFFFTGVAMQPGKPVVFGQIRRTQGSLPFFALPGNPVSSAVTFHLFAAPLLAALMQRADPVPRFALAQFSGTWRGGPGLTRFLPAWCDFEFSPQVRLVPWQGSGDIAAFARCNCLVMIPSTCTELAEGSTVSILLTGCA